MSVDKYVNMEPEYRIYFSVCIRLNFIGLRPFKLYYKANGDDFNLFSRH